VILVDTSVWIDHLHRAQPTLVELLLRDEVACHPLVIEELMLGSIASLDAVLASLTLLQRTAVATHAEVRALVETHQLWGRGLSAVDAHLLASVLLTAGAVLWTRDKRLRTAAGEVGVPLVDWR
jgi:predicted nucleic acid-binding protein